MVQLTCSIIDVQCQVKQSIENYILSLIMTYVVPIGLAVVGLLMLLLGRRTMKAVGLFLLILDVLIYIGIPGYIPPMKGYFGA